MILSMTAFARCVREVEAGTLSLELRSVNHRFCEVSLRLPEELRELETAVRERVTARLKRGKIDVNLRYHGLEVLQDVALNEALVERLVAYCREVGQRLDKPAPVSPMDLLRWPGALQTPEGARDARREALQAAVLSMVDEALTQLIETRAREGARLAALLEERCAAIGEILERAKGAVPVILERQRERLLARIAELKAAPDQARLEQELVYLAQKLDVTEEIDRAQLHLDEVVRVLGGKGPVGRRLDFLMQELNREANTLGSKSADIDTTNASVDMKVLIEQMREQVQNIE